MASASPPPAVSQWTKHISPTDGRPYWSHPQKGSVWEKPDDLKTPLELEITRSGWKEYETGGRKYWVHATTKETTWTTPKDVSEIMARHSTPAVPTPPRPVMPPTGPAAYRQQSPLAGSMSPAPPVGGLTPHTGALVAPGGFGAGSPGLLPPRPSALPAPAATTNVTFATHAEAEAAFKGMLRNLGVTSTWTWEMVMKEAITEPLYKALKTLAERKAAFEKYLVEERERERQERDKSLARCRKDWFKAMDKLGGGVMMEEGVKSWWSWERGRRVMREKCKDAWAMPKNDEERKILFDEFIAKLRKDEETRKRETRGRNMDKLTGILQSLQLDLAGPVRWQDARMLIQRTPEWHHDPELQRIEPIDMLTVFEDEVRRAEQAYVEQKQRVAEEKRRKARKAREDFSAEDCSPSDRRRRCSSPPARPGSPIYPLFHHDERYLALLGRNMDKLTGILQSLQLDLAGPVRWQDARMLIQRTPEWHHDPELQRIEPIDMLTVFEDEVRRAEQAYVEQKQRVAEEKRRKARKAREDFSALLAELVAADQITAGATWKSAYPLFHHDERYLALLGQPGSSPLDLFWDVVDELDIRAEEDQLLIETVAKEKGMVVKEETTEEEFAKALEGDERVEKMDYGAIKATFEKLHHRAVRHARDERRRAEKKLRLLVDDLRYAFKKVDPPIDVDTATWEDVVPLVEQTDEWAALEGNDEARKTAWEKFVRRQKEKRAEREAMDLDRTERDRQYERERDAERERAGERDPSYRSSRRRGSHIPEDEEHEHERDRRRRLSRSSELPYGEDARTGERKRAAGGAEEQDEASAGGAAEEDGQRERKMPRLGENGDVTKSDGVPSRSSSGDSASPNLASSPLESFAAISTALPTSATGNTPGAGPGGVGYHDRQDSFESPSVGAMPEEESFSTRRHSVDEPDDALRRYRAGLYKYTASRYDEFQADLQRKKGLQHRRSSQ
ncbi:U1 snRNP protein [Rhodotorula toruloides]